MLNYELAKRLKDAGFDLRMTNGPQARGEDDKETDRCIYCHSPIFGAGGETYSVPTLEELIGACGDDFGVLYRWQAQPDYSLSLHYSAYQHIGPENEGEGEKGEGSTPEEAVAELYLALKKKQKITS